MSKSFPVLVASFSVFCTVGCGGSSTTTVTTEGSPTPAAVVPATPADPAPATTTPPATNPDPNPTPTPTGGSDGLTWRAETSGRSDALAAVWGASGSDVWAVGVHVVLHSRGDGAWSVVHEDANEQYQAVYGAGGFVYVGGLVCDAGLCQGGVVLASGDGGATWTRTTVGSGVSGIHGSGDAVYANSGDLYVSRDHFATAQKLPLAWSTTNGVFADGGAVYVFGGERGAQIRRTTDDGASWTMVYSGFSGSQSGYANGVVRGANALFATVDGCYVPYCIAGLLRSNDGGASWSEASRPQDYIKGVWATGDDELYIGGTALMRSADGGATFSKVSDQPIYGVWGASATNVYAVGNGGAILHGTR